MIKRFLILEDGTSYQGVGFGSRAITTGKISVDFNLLGYQESITNPDYHDQIVVFTQPSIGNTGVNQKSYESIDPHTKGIIVRAYSNISTNRRQALSLNRFMKQHHIPGISGLDTRAIVRHLRKHGSMKASIVDVNDQHAFDQLRATVFNRQDVPKVSTPKAFVDPGNGYNVAVIDFGLKNNLLRELAERHCNVVVLPWNASDQQIIELDPDGVILSSGPGSPNGLPPSVLKMIQVIQTRVPLLAIGLGHELFARANGARIKPLPMPYNGSGHPVKKIVTDQIVHVSQNQGYQVDPASVHSTALFITAIDLVNHSIQELHHQAYPAFSVQFNPDGGPGPNEERGIYDEFIDNVRAQLK